MSRELIRFYSRAADGGKDTWIIYANNFYEFIHERSKYYFSSEVVFSFSGGIREFSPLDTNDLIFSISGSVDPRAVGVKSGFSVRETTYEIEYISNGPDDMPEFIEINPDVKIPIPTSPDMEIIIQLDNQVFGPGTGTIFSNKPQ